MRLFQRKSLSAIKGRKGLILPIVMGFTLLFSFELASLGMLSSSARLHLRNEEIQARTFYVAEAAAQKGVAQIRRFINQMGAVPAQEDLDNLALVLMGTSGDYQVLNFQMTLDNQAVNQIDQGDYIGLSANMTDITITADVLSNDPSASDAISISQTIQIQQIPVFQFGVFYDNDLEILPGPDMTFIGSVHSNSDIYASSHNTLSFESTITTAGDFFFRRKNDNSDMGGRVRIQDDENNYEDVEQDGEILDSAHEDWLTEALTRWDSNVKSKGHGTQTLNVPISATDEGREIIKRREATDDESLQEQKMDYKAHIRIVDGVVYNKAGAVIDLNYCSTGGSWASCSSSNKRRPVLFPSQSYSGSCNQSQHFYNYRETKCVRSTEVDINVLKDSPAFQTIKNANPSGVIIYHSDHRNLSSSTYQSAMRLMNGSTLPAKMTFASEHPVYIKGDYNTTSKKMAGVISDSLNIQSNAWSDTNSNKPNINDRTASNTTVNVAVVTGNTETSWGDYNGGFENIHRFLENWSGKTLTYKGSVAVLYNSEIATGEWDASNVYSPPNRNWSFDTDFLNPSNVVPGFPSVISIVAGDWERNDHSYTLD